MSEKMKSESSYTMREEDDEKEEEKPPLLQEHYEDLRRRSLESLKRRRQLTKMAIVGHGQNTDERDNSPPINLKIRGQDGNQKSFTVKKRTSLKKVMINAYCEQMSLSPLCIAFLYDGRRVGMEQTPDELHMEDGDEIDALLHQTGGAFPCVMDGTFWST